jgi:hypothetical protein
MTERLSRGSKWYSYVNSHFAPIPAAHARRTGVFYEIRKGLIA